MFGWYVYGGPTDSGMFMGAPRHTYRLTLLEKDPGYGIFRRHPKSAPPA